MTKTNVQHIYITFILYYPFYSNDNVIFFSYFEYIYITWHIKKSNMHVFLDRT